MSLAKPLAAASLVLGLFSATQALAAENITLNAAGIGVSPVLAWSWGASNSGSTQVGGGGGAGKANFQDLSFTRVTDSQSPNFLKAVATGVFLPTVTLQDGAAVITLKDVLVSSYSVGGTADKKAALTENISLNFQKFTYQVNGVSFAWDIATNKPL